MKIITSQDEYTRDFYYKFYRIAEAQLHIVLVERQLELHIDMAIRQMTHLDMTYNPLCDIDHRIQKWYYGKIIYFYYSNIGLAHTRILMGTLLTYESRTKEVFRKQVCICGLFRCNSFVHIYVYHTFAFYCISFHIVHHQVDQSIPCKAVHDPQNHNDTVPITMKQYILFSDIDTKMYYSFSYCSLYLGNLPLILAGMEGNRLSDRTQYKYVCHLAFHISNVSHIGFGMMELHLSNSFLHWQVEYQYPIFRKDKT